MIVNFNLSHNSIRCKVYSGYVARDWNFVRCVWCPLSRSYSGRIILQQFNI